jgi:hypothetical protein
MGCCLGEGASVREWAVRCMAGVFVCSFGIF